jgi:hypothetical protein
MSTIDWQLLELTWHGRIQGVQGVRTPLPTESAIFPAEGAFFIEEWNFQTKIFPRKGTRSLYKTKFFPRIKILFLQLGKTWKLIPRCQENAY